MFRGEVTRAHEDIEIAVPSRTFPVICQALSELDFVVVGAGQSWPLDSPAYDVMHQTWGRDRSTGLYRLDVLREPHVGATWIYRRDPRIRRPYSTVIRRSVEGIPFMTPEIVLLFKAKHMREKDQQDFVATLPLLGASARAWLVNALQRIHPRHPWLAELST